MTQFWKWTGIALLSVVVLAVPLAAFAEVVREGQWPEAEQEVTLSLEGVTRAEAVRQLAKEAGWSVVIEALSDEPIDLQVEAQPAGRLLELVLSDQRYVAHREGNLLSIRPAPAPAPADKEPAPADAGTPVVAAAPDDDGRTAPAVPTRRLRKALEISADDRIVFGDDSRLEAGEVVADFVVFGGSAEIYGTVTGDVVVMGGSATLFPEAWVEGDAVVMGGSLALQDDTRVDGDVFAFGGEVVRGENAMVQGRVHVGGAPETWLERLGGAVTRSALLFVFGTVLLALAARRMELLRVEIADRPMRTFALGVVGLATTIVVLIALCVTLIGIPIALVAAVLAAFATYAGVAALLVMVGMALLRGRSDNAYVYLAIGCAVYLVASWLPWVGGIVSTVAVIFGIGAIVATRGAGFIKPRSPQAPVPPASNAPPPPPPPSVPQAPDAMTPTGA